MSKLLDFVKRHWFKAIALVAIAYAIYGLFFRVGWQELASTFSEVAWSFVALALLANFASIMLKVASWKIIFDYTFGFRGRWRDLTSALMIGFFVNLIIPARVGELARAYVIRRRQAMRGHSVSTSTIFGTIILERVFDGVVFAFIVVWGIFRMDLPVWADRAAIVLLIISGFFAVTLIVLEFQRERLKKKAQKAKEAHREHHSRWRKLTTRAFGMIARFSEGQKVLRSPWRVGLILCTTTLSWGSQLVAVFFSMHAFHLQEYIGRGHTMLGALLLLILINVAGAVPATPGNVGVFQMATVIPLEQIYDIPSATAWAFSIGLQVIEGSIGLGVGGACMIREGLKLKQVKTGARQIEEEVEEQREELEAGREREDHEEEDTVEHTARAQQHEPRERERHKGQESGRR